MRILARDVSLATRRTENSSLQNVLAGRVDAIAADEHPGLAFMRLQAGTAMVIARVTNRALHELAVGVGCDVLIQTKSVAVLD